MKGFKDSSGKFHPITDYKKEPRKKRLDYKDPELVANIGVKLNKTKHNEGIRLKRAGDEGRDFTKSTTKPSYNFIKYIDKFRDSDIARQYMKDGNRYILSSGSFATALANGDMFDALIRADTKNLAKLAEMRITRGEPEFIDYKGSQIQVDTWNEPDGAGHGSYKHAIFPDGSIRNLDVFAIPATQYCQRCHKPYESATSTGECRHCGYEL